MTRRGYHGGSAARTAIVAISLVVGATLALGPAVPSSLVAFAGEAAASIAPGAAPAAPGPLLDASTATSTTYVAAATTDTTTTDATTVVTTTDATTVVTTTDTTTTTSTTATSTSTSGLPANVLDENGGTVVLGHVELTLKPGALQARARFSLAAATGPDYAGIPPVEAFALGATSLMTKGDVPNFGVPGELVVHTDALDLSGIDASSLRIAELGQNGSWRVLSTTYTTDALYATIDAPGTYGVVGRPSAPRVTLTLVTDAPAAGRHRVDPGSTVTVTVTARPDGEMTTATLFVHAPSDWTVTDADGGAVDPKSGDLSWDPGAVAGGEAVVHRIVLTAPSITLDGGQATYTGDFTARVTQKRAPVYRADPVSVLVAPKFVIEHKVVGKVDRETRRAEYEAEDAAAPDVPRYTVMRIRFRVENPDAVPVSLTPLLQFLDVPSTGVPLCPRGESSDPVGQAAARSGTDGGQEPPPAPAGATPAGTTWVQLPAADARHGCVKFYAAPEGVDDAVDTKAIGEADTRTHDEDASGTTGAFIQAAAGGRTFVPGIHSEGANPGPTVTLPGDGWTEIEFSVRATGWSAYETDYRFRMTDGGKLVEPSAEALLSTGRDPEPDHGPGPGEGGGTQSGVPYLLNARSASTSPRAAGLVAAGAPSSTSPHGDLALTTGSCAACHRSHTAEGAHLGTGPLPQSQQCFVCHNSGGLGASSKIQAQYATATVNDPSTASYYQHPATAANSGHTSALDTEFAGVLNRHAECSDCHNPHSPTATSSLATKTASGWQVSGALAWGSGVSVTNGAANSTPTYGWLSTRPGDESAASYPAPLGPLVYEYQVCFKCHSGYTKLLATTGSPVSSHPSWWALDKGVELNPANQGVHPIEAAGTNTSPKMQTSLNGGTVWRLQTTDTVRCAMCHGTASQTPAGPSASAGVRLDVHAVTATAGSYVRGVLRASYRDRLLHINVQPAETYQASEFTLCFACHSSAPFTDPSGNTRTDTNFRYHGFHTAGLFDKGSSTDRNIDNAGAGSGNALCSECHFRIHSNTYRFGLYTTPANGYLADRLVNFPPNVTSTGTPLVRRWQRDPNTGGGSCTLRCHGAGHTPETY